MTGTLVETQRNGESTGHYRLIGIPGNYIDLPGRGGPVTKDAAQRALAVLNAGGTNLEAETAAYQGHRR